MCSVRRRGGLLAILTMLAAAGCAALEYDGNDAFLEITPEGDTEQILQHQPGRSEVRVTPPAAGYFTATFIYLDPHAEVSVSVDSEEVGEQEDLSFPLDSERVDLEVEFGEGRFLASGEQAQGVLTVERLDLESGRVSFRCVFHGTLVGAEGTKAAVSGFIDAIQEGGATSP